MLELNFDKLNGLLPVIIQDYQSGKVLMLGFMNPEAWRLTRETGKVHYFSRTRNKLWMKGESSGHVQIVKEMYIDCDNDTLLIKAEQVGKATCHEGYESCFFRKIDGGSADICEERIFNPDDVYKK